MSKKNGTKLTWGKAKRILLRDGLRCRYCGVELHLSTVTFDHILPITKGGNWSDKNLIVACRKCNSIKGSDDKPILFPPILTDKEVDKMIGRGQGKPIPKEFQRRCGGLLEKLIGINPSVSKRKI